jgi:hypothetical protein
MYIQNRNEEGANEAEHITVTTEQEHHFIETSKFIRSGRSECYSYAAERGAAETFDQNLSVLEQGRAFAREIDKANELIPMNRFSQDLNVICELVKDIFAQAAKDALWNGDRQRSATSICPQT